MLPENDDALRSFYSRLDRQTEPPAHLEREIAAIVSRRVSRALYAAAAVLIFLLGFAAHALSSRAPEFTHVLFLSSGPTYRPAANPRDRVREYGAWARGLREQDVVIDGVKLKRGASHLSGYFLVRARSLDEAQRIAASCPHVKHGGTIEVREIDGI